MVMGSSVPARKGLKTVPMFQTECTGLFRVKMVTGQEHILLLPTSFDQCILFETEARFSSCF